MPSFSWNNGAFTPATTNDNWTLEADTAGDFCKVVSIGWGGRLTTSTGYRTRWTRPTTAGASTFTALTKASHTPGYDTPLCRTGTFATAPVLATDPAGNLHAQDWNAHGGLGYIVLPLANPWFLSNGVLQGQVSCRNVAGTDANGSSYTVTIEE
jgi:YD repeat-containing protein